MGKFLLFDLLDIARRGTLSANALLRAGVMCACLALAERQYGLRPAAAVLLGLRLLAIAGSFPGTINHAFFDAALLLMIAFGGRSGGRGLHPLRVAQAGILAVFFHSGVQKLASGYYVDGELFALRLLYDDGDMGDRLRSLLEVFGRVMGLPAAPSHASSRPSGMSEVVVVLPGWVWSMLQALSTGTLVAEIGLSLMAFRRKLQSASVAGLLMLEAAILVLTGEISFGFTVVACLLAFFPRAARWTYPVAGTLLGVAAAMLKLSR